MVPLKVDPETHDSQPQHGPTCSEKKKTRVYGALLISTLGTGGYWVNMWLDCEPCQARGTRITASKLCKTKKFRDIDEIVIDCSGLFKAVGVHVISQQRQPQKSGHFPLHIYITRDLGTE